VKILLLSAYAAQSHVYWHENLVAMFPDWDWRVLTLPPRHFSWRVRGNPLYWALEESEALRGDYDLLIATSMVDLATLRGLVPELAALPTALYFHENQFDYPQGERTQSLLEAQMVSLYASLAANRMVFNSAHNQNSFLDGCETLLNKLPDKVPTGVVASLRARSQVLAVPLRQDSKAVDEGIGCWSSNQEDYPARPLRLLWVGRFEYDKGGDALLLCLRELERLELSYELALVGQQFRSSPAAFTSIEREFSHVLVQFGYIESREAYRQTLAGADVVLSTALHEFQGLAILEAVAAGCLPAVPDRLVYPEILPSENCYQSFPHDPAKEAEKAAALIFILAGRLADGCVDIPDVSAFSPAALEPAYRALFSSLLQHSQ